MANGDDATAAGMDVLDGTEDRREGYDEINKTRDYIAQFFTNAVATVKAWVELLFVPKTDVYDGQTDRSGLIVKYNPGSTITTFDPTANGHAATKRYVDQEIAGIGSGGVPATGGTFTGQVYFPNAYAASSGYAVAYINGDGRLARNASSERYKKYITEIDPATLGNIWPALSRYQMRGGDGSWKYGYIAERLNEIDDQQPFVVYQTVTEYDAATDTTTTRLAVDGEGNPVPDSIDFIALLMAQNAQLHQAVDLLTQRLDALETP